MKGKALRSYLQSRNIELCYEKDGTFFPVYDFDGEKMLDPFSRLVKHTAQYGDPHVVENFNHDMFSDQRFTDEEIDLIKELSE